MFESLWLLWFLVMNHISFIIMTSQDKLLITLSYLFRVFISHVITSFVSIIGDWWSLGRLFSEILYFYILLTMAIHQMCLSIYSDTSLQLLVLPKDEDDLQMVSTIMATLVWIWNKWFRIITESPL